MYGKTEASDRDLRMAIRLADRVWSQPYPNACRRVKGTALIDLSEILLMKNELDESRRASSDAIQLLEPLAEPARTSANTPHHRWLLALALTDRAIASMEAGVNDAARDDLNAAEKVCKRILESDAENNDAQYQLACILSQRADLLTREPAKLLVAEQIHSRAARILETLILHYKLIPSYPEQMAVTLSGRAAVRLAMGAGRLADARSDCDESRRLLEGLIAEEKRKEGWENPNRLSLLGRALERASLIYRAQGERSRSLEALADAADKLTLSLKGDAARARDELMLKRITARLAEESLKRPESAER